VSHRVQVAEEEHGRDRPGEPTQDQQVLDARPPDGFGAERREPAVVDVDAGERLPESRNSATATAETISQRRVPTSGRDAARAKPAFHLA
jgi:hypothetical protein